VKNAPKAVRPLDLPFLGAILAATMATWWWSLPPAGAPAPTAVQVMAGDGPTTGYDLPREGERRVDLRGPLGVTTLVLTPAGARITTSPCPHHRCVGQGRVTRPGQALVCIPNRVLVHVVGRPRLDGVTQ